jgi:hypothetical protein
LTPRDRERAGVKFGPGGIHQFRWTWGNTPVPAVGFTIIRLDPLTGSSQKKGGCGLRASYALVTAPRSARRTLFAFKLLRTTRTPGRSSIRRSAPA